ncbi:MAG: hypothetical protein AAF267_19580 [Deinococcota bacterium]
MKTTDPVGGRSFAHQLLGSDVTAAARDIPMYIATRADCYQSC